MVGHGCGIAAHSAPVDLFFDENTLSVGQRSRACDEVILGVQYIFDLSKVMLVQGGANEAMVQADADRRRRSRYQRDKLRVPDRSRGCRNRPATSRTYEPLAYLGLATN